MERRPYGAPGGEPLVDQLPNLGREKEMLAAMGLSSMEELFSDIPEHVRRRKPLDLPEPQSEEEILRDARMLLGTNIPVDSRPSFLKFVRPQILHVRKPGWKAGVADMLKTDIPNWGRKMSSRGAVFAFYTYSSRVLGILTEP